MLDIKMVKRIRLLRYFKSSCVVGDDVKAVQIALMAAGLDPKSNDGRYKLNTKAAVESFQAKKGLTIDGITGPKTWTKLAGC